MKRYFYVARSDKADLTKIGITNDIQKRLVQLPGFQLKYLVSFNKNGKFRAKYSPGGFYIDAKFIEDCIKEQCFEQGVDPLNPTLTKNDINLWKDGKNRISSEVFKGPYAYKRILEYIKGTEEDTDGMTVMRVD